MRYLAVLGVVLLLMVLFLYLVLPGLVESRLAADLQGSYGLAREPEVDISSSFPPELLLGRIDWIGIQIDQLRREGILLRNVRLELENVDVSLESLLQGDLERDIRTGSLVAEVPETSINDYLRENDLGLGGGEIDVLPQGVVYRSPGAFLGLPASVNLDLQVAGPHEIAVIPQGAAVAGIELPPFFTRPLAAGGRTLDIGDLPLGAGLTGVEPSPEEALIVRAERWEGDGRVRQ